MVSFSILWFDYIVIDCIQNDLLQGQKCIFVNSFSEIDCLTSMAFLSLNDKGTMCRPELTPITTDSKVFFDNNHAMFDKEIATDHSQHKHK